MFKKILVGLDVYVEAQHAFDDALFIAKKQIHYSLCYMSFHWMKFITFANVYSMTL